MKSTGTIQAGTGLWNSPNTGATNESGFAGLPGGGRGNDGAFISIGLVIDAVISFVIVAFILFLVLRGYNKLKADAEEDSGPSETDLLTEIRDQLRANNS